MFSDQWDGGSLIATGSSCCPCHFASWWHILGMSPPNRPKWSSLKDSSGLRGLGGDRRRESVTIQLLCVLVQGRKCRKPNLASSPSYFLESSFGNNRVELLNATSLLCLFLNSFRSQRRRAVND